ncbi:MAG: helix-turn-helix domain-containing protein [Acidimicrobiia bacterium]
MIHLDPEPPLVFSVEQAAARLGISRAFAYQLVARGELPALRLGRRIVVPRFAIDEVLARASRTTD